MEGIIRSWHVLVVLEEGVPNGVEVKLPTFLLFCFSSSFAAINAGVLIAMMNILLRPFPESRVEALTNLPGPFAY